MDRRNLDERVRSVLAADGFPVPILWVDDMEALKPQKLAQFLSDAGVAVDQRTSTDHVWTEGPQHVVVYRRAAKNEDRDKIHPILKRTGTFRLVAESGQEVFSGDAAALAAQGIRVPLTKWRSAILRIES